MITPFEKVFLFIKKPWVIIFYVFLVVLAYNFIDIPLATYFCNLHLGSKVFALNLLTALGKWSVYVILFFSTGLLFHYLKNYEWEKKSWYLFGCVISANLVCTVLKIALSRARPELLFGIHEFGFYGFKWNEQYWSFPSGHTTTVISVAGGMGILYPRYFYLLFFSAFLVILTRILLCFHYLTDVMAAFYLTMLVIGFFTEYLQKRGWLKTVH